MHPQSIYFDVEAEFCPFLRFDRDNGLHTQAVLTVHGDEPFETEVVSLEAMLEILIYPSIDRGDYQFVYCVAHEFRRITEKLTDLAQKMEDGNNAITDLYDMTTGDLDE